MFTTLQACILFFFQNTLKWLHNIQTDAFKYFCYTLRFLPLFSWTAVVRMVTNSNKQTRCFFWATYSVH